MNRVPTFPKMPDLQMEASESVRDSSDDESQELEDSEIINLISQVTIT